jgi:hypothetical protein
MILNRVFVSRLALVAAVAAASAAGADPTHPTNVPSAQPKSPGMAVPNALSPELTATIAAQGGNPLENPADVDLGGGTLVKITHYGYYGDGTLLPVIPSLAEATKSEPDKNTYLVLPDATGADPDYNYGHHFLFQGHELGPKSSSLGNSNIGYITRVNLDADFAHRVTLMATTDSDGNPLRALDGSTWNPFAERLLFSAENGANGAVYQATLDFPSKVEDLAGSFGRGGYEGMQTDRDGNVWVVEDVGGPAGATNTHAKQPNSFLYRFVPKNPHDLKEGKLQVLQVLSLRSLCPAPGHPHQGCPIVFHAGQADADILSDDVKDLHTYGNVFATHWVTIHDTATDGTAPFDANALAKARNGTPFKRPENGQFRPGSDFTQFFFDETGDTNVKTEAGSAFGGFGAILRLTQRDPSSNEGRLRLFYLGDLAHTGLDNCAFWSDDKVVFVEDGGDGLHRDRNALDSAYLFDVRKDYSDPANQPIRILAEGRDTSATLDSALGDAKTPGFQNEGDNEITGIHVSDGDPGFFGLLGAKTPHVFRRGWRVFFTQQHGDNVTWEILPAPRHAVED